MKQKPKNIVDDQLRGMLFVTSDRLIVRLGKGAAIDTPNVLVVGGETVIGAKRAEDGRVLMSAQIFSEDGVVLAKLSDNEWTLRPSGVWDFEASPLHATVRQASRKIAFDIDTRKDEVSLCGRWFCHGMLVEFTPSMFNFGTNTAEGLTTVGGKNHIVFG